jgi:hypothetical protein
MQWIKTSDRLPSENKQVLCFQPGANWINGGEKTKPRILMGSLFSLRRGERDGSIDLEELGDKGFNLWAGGIFWGFPYICHQNFVTHWMELPSFPGEQDDAPAWLTVDIRSEAKSIWQQHVDGFNDHKRVNAVKYLQAAAKEAGLDRLDLKTAMELMRKFCI